MEFTLENIKEISLTSTSKEWAKSASDVYTESYCFSMNRVSYLREGLNDISLNDAWTYESDSERFHKYFNLACEELIKLYQSDIEIPDIEHCCRFYFKVILNDDTVIKFKKLPVSLRFNHLDLLASYLRKVIPPHEEVPDPMVPNCKLDKFCREFLSTMKEEHPVALMYSDSNALHEPNVVEVITDGDVLYYMHPEKEEYAISPFDVLATFDGFEPINQTSDPIKYVKLNDEIWIYLSMENGNHLFVEKKFFKEYFTCLFDLSASKRYDLWVKFTSLIVNGKMRGEE